MLNEGVRVEEAPACLLCGSGGAVVYDQLRDRLFAAPGVWSLRRCGRCTLHWLDPRPTADAVGALYREYYTHTTQNPSLVGVRTVVKRAVLARAFGYDGVGGRWPRIAGGILAAIAPVRDRVGMGIDYLDAARRGRLLDVGCGSGLFLHRMKRLGWTVRGIDPDPEAARLARHRYDIDVTVGHMEDRNFSDEFDVVTLNHVIEHALDPPRLLSRCAAAVKRGGRVVIITPNVESYGHATMRRSWLPLDPPRHLYLFSVATLTECVRRAGLEVENVRTSARSAAAVWTGSDQIARTNRGSIDVDASLRFHPRGVAFQLREEVACALGATVGEELLVTARRP
jgi:2-polyprenyl-3-methyl-5-hydroxy-6-metoxy-1,4-benzoquinol methylase